MTFGLYTRCHGRCEVCDRQIIGDAERHHRQRREVGGDRYANLLLLHSACHQWVHAHPAEARQNGWIVSAYADPLSVPVLSLSRWWALDDEGGRTLVPPPGGAYSG